MAGLYPDVPDTRIAYDRDGTSVFFVNRGTGNIVTLNQTQINAINDEAVGTYNWSQQGATLSLGFVFPELRDITHYNFGYGGGIIGGGLTNIEISTDSTNIYDGTWTSLGAMTSTTGGVAGVRTGIRVLGGATGVRAIRFNAGNTNGSIQQMWLHLYGSITAGENPHRLVMWHPTLDEPATGALFDIGDIPRGTQTVCQFRIKNISPAQTASTITIGLETLTNPTPSILTQHALSLDGVSYAATQSIASLAPGAVSSVVYIRQQMSVSAAVGPWSIRFYADAASWA